MTRKYGDRVLVAQQHDQPRCFIWRGATYHVQAVLARWHLRDRWWQTAPPGQFGAQAAPESDRHYYRLECSPELQCELYYDAASDCWILERVYD